MMDDKTIEFFELLLKLIGVLAPIFFGYYKYITDRKDRKQKEEIKLLKNDNKVIKEGAYMLSNLMKLNLYDELSNINKKIYSRTKAMRFIVFVAVNGKTSPNTVYAVFGHRKDDPDVDKKYKGVEVDSDYVLRLKELENKGSLIIETLSMPKGMLKDIYYEQLITYSYLKFIKRYSLSEEDDALVYCSVATDLDEGFVSMETTEIDLLISSEIKPLIDKIITV
ncbi:hypothetical protein [Tenacibaculum sp. SZ-18]|uniref:hypothetical protein n=1 Tax=Tenacibaculum sp. SZ-18 TaxID=754423 RepID=UPI0012FE308E|nr:hypothetical protein [Tenacibaculum sp. SZ-18]